MIGTYIRNFRHLKRSVGDKPKRFLISFNQSPFISGEAIIVKDKKYGKDIVLLFQSYHTNVDTSDLCKRHSEDSSQLLALMEKYRGCAMLDRPESYRCLQGNFIMLPETFDDDYNEFVKSNRKLFEPFFEKYGMNNNRNQCEILYCLCHNAPNLFTWAIKCIYGNRINMNYIFRILNWSNNYNQLVSKLNKGTITAYNSREQILHLIEEMRILRRNKRANDMINIFNTVQKKLLKSIEMGERQYQILGKFGRLSKTKQVNFVRKMSTIENVDEIFRQLAFVVDVHFEWNKESLLEYIANSDGIICDIVENESDYILLRVHNYETIKRIAKNTNWCISKNKRYWNDYIDNKCGDATQYLLCDFSKNEDDKLSIVGFTITTNVGITSAHNFVNENLMKDGGRPLPIKKIVSEINSIHTILASKNISLNKIMNYEEPLYEWNKEAFLSYLNTCVSHENVVVYYQENNKMVLSVTDNNLKYFMGDKLEDMLGDDGNSSNTYFMFVDFNKPSNDNNRLKICKVYNREDGHSTSCSDVLNVVLDYCPETFDNLLEDFCLPYTIIPRIEDNIERFTQAFTNFDIRNVKKFICLPEVREHLLSKTNETCEKIYNTLNWSLLSYKSLDMLMVIYDSNLTLSLILPNKLISYLSYNILRGASTGRHHITPMIANEELLAKFYNNQIQDTNTALGVGLYVAFKAILDNEPIKVVYEKIGCHLCELRGNDLTYHIMEQMIEIINFNEENETTFNFMKMVNVFYNKALLNRVLEMDINNFNVLQVLLGTLSNRCSQFEPLRDKLTILKNAMPRKKKKTVNKDNLINLDEAFSAYSVTNA